MERRELDRRYEEIADDLEKVIEEIGELADQESDRDRRDLVIRASLAGRRMVSHLQGATNGNLAYAEE